MFNHQPSFKENPANCNVHYCKFPYPFGCTNNLENAMSEYIIVENVNLEPAIMNRSLDAKFKTNQSVYYALVSYKEDLLIRLVEQLISLIITVLITFVELHLTFILFVCAVLCLCDICTQFVNVNVQF